jgi:hypothetical protein
MSNKLKTANPKGEFIRFLKDWFYASFLFPESSKMLIIA